jgi:hypothetical protein
MHVKVHVQLEEGRQAQNNKSASELKLNPQGTFSYQTIGRGRFLGSHSGLRA